MKNEVQTMRLIDAPVGLLEFDGTVILKTEYMTRHSDGSVTPDCNTCCLKQCEYRPEIGQTTRFNCPLWRGQKEE